MSQQNKALARRFFEEMLTQGKLEISNEIFVQDFVFHTPFGELEGPTGSKQFASMLRTGFPDLRVTIEDQIAEGDKVMTRWTARGTHSGEFQGVSPTGNQIAITGIVASRIANNKIVEQWGNPDLFGLMRQIGAVPSPEQSR